MRKALFRGKVKKLEGYQYPELIDTWTEGFYLEDLFNGRTESFIFNCPCYLPVDSETVGQFTGLTDKNGEEIYEGDIVGNSMIGEDWFAIIGFNDGAFTISSNHSECHVGDCWLYASRASMIEIIGNIHDNPSLLTNKE